MHAIPTLPLDERHAAIDLAIPPITPAKCIDAALFLAPVDPVTTSDLIDGAIEISRRQRVEG